MDNLLQDLLAWIAQHPHFSNLLIFVVAVLESLLVIGLLVPGAFLLFGIGALIATGTLQLIPTMVWTSAGAVVGDTVSFLIGSHYHQRLRVLWPLKRYPALVNRGVDFFCRHGGKSVFMARFVGPVRPIVPAIAGMMDMNIGRFLLVDIIASVLWAPAYILPGMAFGASLGLAAEVAGRLVVLLVVVAGIIWLSFALIRGVWRLLQPHASAAVESVLGWSRKHPRLRPLAGSLLDPDHPEARGLAILLGLLFLAFWALLLITRQTLHGRFIGDLDNYLFHFLQNLRTPGADQVMTFVSLFGKQLLLAIVLSAGSLWLFWMGNHKAAIHWLVAYVCTVIMTYALKYSTSVERPVDIHHSFSFPSAHVSTSLAVFGFLALLIARELPFKHRWLPYTVAGILVVAIAFSRLYLGVHWFSDILGGASVGLLWVTLLGIAYDRHPAPALPQKRLLGVSLAVLFMAVAWQLEFHYRQDLANYAPRMEIQTVTLSDWLNNDWRELPVYRIDIEGVNAQPLNFQWAGTLTYLQEVLGKQGWQPAPKIGVLRAMNWLSPHPESAGLPILSQVHDGEQQKLLLARKEEGTDRMTVLRVWPANIETTDNGTRIWVGTVSYLYVDHSLPMIAYLKTATDFDSPLAVLRDALEKYAPVRTVNRDVVAPAGMEWHGEVLLGREAGDSKDDLPQHGIRGLQPDRQVSNNAGKFTPSPPPWAFRKPSS
jgi:membrane protein DedA with SNARE-associated domain/membrane-associated phospholipid phosphatase